MPCYQTGSREGDALLEAEEARAGVTKLTRLLCSACSILESLEDGQHLELWPKDLSVWWRDHKSIDDQRRLRENQKKHRAKIRKRALAKLTEEEKNSLYE